MFKLKFPNLSHNSFPIGLALFSTAMMLFAAPAQNTVQAAVQQSENQVTGMVTDENKEPLTGVTVTVVDGKANAVTDIDGLFRIQAEKGQTLEFSYIGFKKKTVKLTGAKLLNIVLEEETSEMEEVIVTGYSSQKKASIIGSIETIKPDELKFGTNLLP